MGEDPPEDDDELVEQYFDCVLEEYDIAWTLDYVSRSNRSPRPSLLVKAGKGTKYHGSQT